MKIYIAAGPLNRQKSKGSFEVRGCRHLLQEACGLYEIDWPVPEGRPPHMYVRRLVDASTGGGVARPDVHRRKPLVLFGQKDPTAFGFDSTVAEVVDVMSGSVLPWDGGNALRAYAPTWGAGTTVWYNLHEPAAIAAAGDPRFQQLWSAYLHVARDGVRPDAETQRFPFVDLLPLCSFGWPAVSPTDPDRVATQTVWNKNPALGTLCPWLDHASNPDLGGGPNELAVCFPAAGSVIDVAAADAAATRWVSAEEAPVSADPQNWWQLPLRAYDPRNKVEDQESDRVYGLAHADFSPDGGTVIWYEQEGMVKAGQALRTEDRLETSRTVAYRLGKKETVFEPVELQGVDPDAWYTHPRMEDLPYPMDIISTAGVQRYLHKYARFCGVQGDAQSVRAASDHWIVVMVAGTIDREGPEECSAGDLTDFDVVFNRVYLVDLTDRTSPVYHDLTLLIEYAEGEDAGTFGATQAHCSPWYESPGPLPADEVWPDEVETVSEVEWEPKFPSH